MQLNCTPDLTLRLKTKWVGKLTRSVEGRDGMALRAPFYYSLGRGFLGVGDLPAPTHLGIKLTLTQLKVVQIIKL